MKHGEAFDLNAPFNLAEFFKRMFEPDFMPHGHCFSWRPDVLWLNVGADITIGVSYYLIAATLAYFVIRRKGLPFHWMFLMFGAFIFLCGTTHFVDVWTMWSGQYRIEGIVKLLTGIVSIVTAILLFPILPRAMKIPNLEKLNQELSDSNLKLVKINQDLERFNRASIGREKRISELKREINLLNRELGREMPYDPPFDSPDNRQQSKI